jgi:hypothetical protein
MAPGAGHERPRAPQIVCSLGGVANGFPREGGFDITVASEIMAILCLATRSGGSSKRLGDIIVAYRRDRSAVTARDLEGRRRHDRAPEGGHPTEPCADAGKQSGLHPRRPVRQHRPRLQLGRWPPSPR